MDHLHFQQGLPPALLEALQTMSDGGVLYAVAQADPPSEDRPLVPSFIVRSPATRAQLATTNIELTTRLILYEEEGPLTIFHFNLYDRPPQTHTVRVHGRSVGIRIQPTHPFELECFLNPTVDEDRLMLQALGASTVMNIEFYGIDTAMTYQATKQYIHPVEQQQAAWQVLKETRGMTSSPERFRAAQQRFMQEHPLFL